MTEKVNSKLFDLEARTQIFAKSCREFVKKLPKAVGNYEDGKQLVRSSGSTAANYIEANESLSKRDFCHRVKICRKEAKESILWLNLCDTGSNEILNTERIGLIKETTELMKIFGAIIEKVK